MTCGDKTGITVKGKLLIGLDNLKLLGITIDCGFNFNLPFCYVCKIDSQKNGGIMRLRNLIPVEAK